MGGGEVSRSTKYAFVYAHARTRRCPCPADLAPYRVGKQLTGKGEGVVSTTWVVCCCCLFWRFVLLLLVLALVFALVFALALAQSKLISRRADTLHWTAIDN